MGSIKNINRKLKENEIDDVQPTEPLKIDRYSLKDIQDVNVNTDLPKEARIKDFISQIGSPYCYRHGDYIVRNRFADTDTTLEDRVMSYLAIKYK